MSFSQDLVMSSTFPDRKYISQTIPAVKSEEYNGPPLVSLLEKSKGVMINNSAVTAIGQVNHIHHYHIYSAVSGLRILGKAIAQEAIHNLRQRQFPPRELAENQEMIGAIVKWATRHPASASILWVASPEGAHKSLLTEVAQAVAEQLDEDGHLGGGFFFNKDVPKCDREKALFPTLAYQLVKHNPVIAHYIDNAMSMDPTLLTGSMTVQFRELLARPFRKMIHSYAVDLPLSTIIIDALEDCSTTAVQIEILQSFVEEVEREIPVPLQFLIFSKPKKYIRDLLKNYGATELVLPIDPYPKQPRSSNPVPGPNRPSLQPTIMIVDPKSISSVGSTMSVDQDSVSSLPSRSTMSVDPDSASLRRSTMSVDPPPASLRRSTMSVDRDSVSLRRSPMSVDPQYSLPSLQSTMSVDLDSVSYLPSRFTMSVEPDPVTSTLNFYPNSSFQSTMTVYPVSSIRSTITVKDRQEL